MAISPCKVPGVQSSVGPPNAPYATGSLDARYPSKSPNALMIEDGITSPECWTSVLRLVSPCPAACVVGNIVVMGVNHKCRIVNGSLVLEPVEVSPPPPPLHPSFSVAAPPRCGVERIQLCLPSILALGVLRLQGRHPFQVPQALTQVHFDINHHHLALQLLPRLRALQPRRVLVFKQLPLRL